jgi:hypothetical protein
VSAGLYSGVSGLALGIGLYRNVSGLWGGASGLIDGFGGADPYAGASLYLNFLDPTLDSRITFSRGTNATLIDSTGKLTYAPNNLVTQSQDFTPWGATAASTTANVGVAPDGTTTADLVTANGASSSHTIAFSATAGISRIFSVYLKAGTNNFAQLYFSGDGAPFANFNLATGTVGTVGSNQTATIESVGNGWYRCAIFTNSTTAGNLIIGIISSATVARAEVNSLATSILVWGAQLEQVTYQTTPGAYNATTASAYYGPRFDYDPVTLAPRGLLIEEARTNLALYSEQFDNAAWTKFNATVTANVTASPDGTVNADKLAEDATAGVGHLVSQGPTLTAVAHTYSVYAKASERNWICLLNNSIANALAFFNLATGTIGTVGSGATATITNAGNGWYRCSITFTAIAATNNCHIRLAPSDNVLSYNGVAGNGAFIYGAQLEAGGFATSYIPTVASTVTRNADVAIMTGTNFSSWYNQPAGTFIADVGRFSSVNSTGTAGFLSATDNPLANDWILMFGDGIGTPSIYVTGGVTQANLVGVPITSGGKVSFAYAANDFAASVNGGTVLTDTSGTLTTDITVLRIGAFASNPNYLNGHIRQIAYFNTRLPNTQLQTLTAPSLATTLSLDFTSGSYNVGF